MSAGQVAVDLPTSNARIRQILVSARPLEGPSSLVGLLHRIHSEMGYLPAEAVPLVAEALDMPASKVYSVATFYTMFSVKPRGRHVIRICESAPCHVEGARAVIAAIEAELGVAVGDTTLDDRFTVEFSSCIGVCGVAPAIMIDDQVYGNLTPDRIPHILRQYS